MFPARLFLVRHGQTASNVSQILRGPSSADDPLDAVGEAQARAVASHLAALNLPRPRVYASPYLRARQTGEAIAAALGVPLTLLDGVREIDPGDWVGRPYSDLRTFSHELLHPAGGLGFPGGESLADVAARFRAALPAHPEPAVIVSHGAALTALLAALLGVDHREAWAGSRFAHANTAVSELEWDGERWRAVRLADASHLPTAGA
ncbi:phosphoglyceromutase 2, co-factor independent, gpm [Deinococcus aerius]|uniref:Phosphoglyceromutase 2, co-factor independent, gpm n=1 Tax=Deinococcus aerius TaxID=200253 RepID=A0A2I9DV00_9DEIO|nr:histidine phosphatase family protein [Deinococcus aerius]GBF06627.1 phosphoglyceromutase 2, co-factor independent, gpm [Deinococcus aerius]